MDRALRIRVLIYKLNETHVIDRARRIERRQSLVSLRPRSFVPRRAAPDRTPRLLMPPTSLGCNAPVRPIPRARLCTTRSSRRVALFYSENDEFIDQASSFDDFLVPELASASLTVDTSCPIGTGAFSEVFIGIYDGDDVICKRFRSDVRGRDVESFYVDELESARALKTCSGVAPFIGACGLMQWLIWKNVGTMTLENALDLGDNALAMVRKTLNREESDAATLRFLAREMLEATASVHGFEFIHRDIKPANAILDERNGKIVLCDVGACADVRTGRNMSGDEAIFDPTYGAPEQFQVVAKRNSTFPNIGGLFGRKPDEAETLEYEATGATPTELLDAFSLGVTLLRVGVPSLRSAGAIARARRDIDACGGDVETWRRDVCVPGVNDWSLVDETGAWNLIAHLTDPDPSARLSVRRALDEDYFH